MRKLPILLKRIARKENQPGKLVIGVIGTHHGAGATHFSILLANYLSEWLGKNIAYIECCPQRDIQQMQYIYEGMSTQAKERAVENSSFVIYRVTYYKSVRPAELAEIIGGSYDCVILDMGLDFTKNKHEFFRCDKKFVVSSLAPWKQQELERFIENTSHINQSDEWMFMIPFGQSKETKQVTKVFQRKFYEVPNEPDPFSLSAETIHLFQNLL